MNALKAKLRGTWNYYGLIGNFRRLKPSTKRPVGRYTSGSTGGVSARV